MIVHFRTTRLEECYRKHRKAYREFGPEVGRKYIERVNIIKATPHLDTLIKQRTLRCHPLKGKRKGQWAINLTGSVRLIFTIADNELQIVRIEEVSKHYGE